MRLAVIGVLTLAAALPAHAAKLKPAKATDAELLDQLATAQTADQLAILDELEDRSLNTACPALAERNALDDGADVRARSLALMHTLGCPNLLDAATLAVSRDRFPANRLAALGLVRVRGDAAQVPLLQQVLADDSSVQVRHKALTIAIETGWEGTAPLVMAALRDDYNPIVQDAAVVLVAAEDPAARQALIEEVPTLKPGERELVMAVWQDHPMAGDTGYLLATLDDSHAPVAISAAAALGGLGDAKVVPVLQQKLATEKDKDVRRALTLAIETLER